MLRRPTLVDRNSVRCRHSRGKTNEFRDHSRTNNIHRSTDDRRDIGRHFLNEGEKKKRGEDPRGMHRDGFVVTDGRETKEKEKNLTTKGNHHPIEDEGEEEEEGKEK